MNLGIDLWAINCSKNHGIGNYAEQLCIHLMKQFPENEFIFLSWSDKTICNEIFGTTVTYQEDIVGDISRHNEESAKYCIQKFVKKWKIETYIDISPIWGQRPNLKHTWFGSQVKLVCVAHDLIPYVLRDKYYGYRDSDGYHKYISAMYNIEQYDYIFTNSEYTKKDIAKYIGINDDRLFCVYCSSGNARVNNDISKINLEYDIKRHYFLYAAGDAKQKNIPQLLLAYAKAFITYNDIPDILITGNYSYRSRQLINSIIEYYGIEQKVIMTGYISDIELDYLYENCDWVLYPSLYEGFGMPVTEAWEHSAPVLTSNNSSLYEIANGAAVLVDPKDTESIKEGLLKIAHMNEEERLFYIVEGKKRAKIYTWDNTVRLLMKYLSNLPVEGMKNAESKKKQKIANEKVILEMQEWNRIREVKGIIEETIDSKRKRNNRSNILLHNWMTVRAKRKWIEDYLYEKEYYSIAIYGFGIMAWHLLSELTDKIKVNYIIDQDETLFHPRYEVVTLLDTLKEVDLIIVTTVNDFNQTKDKILEKIDCSIISLENIVEQLMR